MNKIVTCILFFLTAINNSLAQLCTGTLGNPVVNITFGGGPNPGPQLSQVPSSYQYTNLDCPSEGFYTLRNSTSTCPGDLWHDVSFDHTANDQNGYFLLINAREGTSDIYTETIRGLCPNTKFELSIWILNLLKPTSCLGGGSDPNITIGVSDLAGTALATYNTGKISETPRAAWIQYRFQFLSPSSGDVVININNTGSGCGNDFAIDDITFRPCGGTMNTAFIGYPGSQIQTCSTELYADRNI